MTKKIPTVKKKKDEGWSWRHTCCKVHGNPECARCGWDYLDCSMLPHLVRKLRQHDIQELARENTILPLLHKLISKIKKEL